MDSIQIKVPRKLIKKFSPHPEDYGDYVAILQNNMYTDVYYDETEDFLTITNDKNLISYLNDQKSTATKFVFRNGVFSFKEIQDVDIDFLSNRTKNIPDYNEVIRKSQCYNIKEFDQNQIENFPKRLIFMYKWIEVGVVEITLKKSEVSLTIEIYENHLIDESNFDICLLVLKEHLLNKTQ